MTDYLTNGRDLYEVDSRLTHKNFGCLGGTITDTVVRDVITGEMAHMDELSVAALSEVKAGA